VVTWRRFTRRELTRVIRELGIPSATNRQPSGRYRCPRHGTRIGPITGICLTCHTETWDEVGRRYAAESRPGQPEHRISSSRLPNRTRLSGQLSLLGEETTSEEETMNTSSDLVKNEPVTTVVDEPASTPLTLFGTSDPKVALQRMSDVASVLVDVIKDRKLFARISGHEHITAEGWTTLGGMLGVVPVVCWTKPNETGDGYVARVEARTIDGRVVGAAESECSRAERRWKQAEPYAMRSMAQTRAIGRALRAPLGQIVVLAGYEPASAEEVPTGDRDVAPGHLETVASEARMQELRGLIARLEEAAPEQDWRAHCRSCAGVPPDQLTDEITLELIRNLRGELATRTAVA
jgi:hypothetical protein